VPAVGVNVMVMSHIELSLR